MSDPTAKDEAIKTLAIAKKIHLDLAELEIQDHVVIVNVLTQLCQHRTQILNRQLAEQEKDRARAAQFGVHKVASARIE